MHHVAHRPEQRWLVRVQLRSRLAAGQSQAGMWSTVTAPMRTSPAPTSAAHRRQRTAVNAPIIYVADPWQDWKRHYAQLRHNRTVQLWDGGRPVVLTMCGQLGQTGTEVRHATDCEGCKHARTAEQSATIEMQRPLRKQEVAA